MSDLLTLTDILNEHASSKSRHSQSNMDLNLPYVPPPATSTELTNQLIFFSNPDNMEIEHIKHLNLLMQLVLLPAVQTRAPLPQ
jgi:hypothetical protein